MKNIKLVPFILIIIGTIGLLGLELFGISGSSFSRSAVLVFAVFNFLGLIILTLSNKN